MSQQEPQQYDQALKSLLGDEAAEILPRLIEGVELIGEQNIEIDRTTLKADLVYNILYKGEPHILNMELQTDADKNMPKRMLKYHVGLLDKHGLPVISIVMYPFETSIPEPPYREMSGDEEILTFHYKVLPLWKLDAQQFVRDRVVAMYTLLPAMKNVSVPLLVQALKDMKQYYAKEQFGHHLARFIRILQRSKSLSEQEKQAMNAELHNYDSFIDENPEIQERVAKGRAEGERQALQQMVLEAVKDQYPPLTELAKEQVVHIGKPDDLRQLVKLIYKSTDENMVRWLLNNFAA